MHALATENMFCQRERFQPLAFIVYSTYVKLFGRAGKMALACCVSQEGGGASSQSTLTHACIYIYILTCNKSHLSLRHVCQKTIFKYWVAVWCCTCAGQMHPRTPPLSLVPWPVCIPCRSMLSRLVLPKYDGHKNQPTTHDPEDVLQSLDQ